MNRIIEHSTPGFHVPDNFTGFADFAIFNGDEHDDNAEPPRVLPRPDRVAIPTQPPYRDPTGRAIALKTSAWTRSAPSPER